MDAMAPGKLLTEGVFIVGKFGGASVKKWAGGQDFVAAVTVPVDWGDGEYRYDLVYQPATLDELGNATPTAEVQLFRKLAHGERVLCKVRAQAKHSRNSGTSWVVWELEGMVRAPCVVPVAATSGAQRSEAADSDRATVNGTRV